MRFLVDAQLPLALARQIETLGHSADHVFDCGLATASDEAIRAYAAKIGAVIVTKDEDFVIRRVLQQGPAVVWVRIGNTRRAERFNPALRLYERLGFRQIDDRGLICSWSGLPRRSAKRKGGRG